MTRRFLGGLLLVVAILASCSGDEAVSIDLNSTTVLEPAVPNTSDSAGPNDVQNQEVVRYAEQQCLDNSDLDEGYVKIVVPGTDEQVGEVSVDCAEVRSRKGP